MVLGNGAVRDVVLDLVDVLVEHVLVREPFVVCCELGVLGTEFVDID